MCSSPSPPSPHTNTRTDSMSKEIQYVAVIATLFTHYTFTCVHASSSHRVIQESKELASLAWYVHTVMSALTELTV